MEIPRLIAHRGLHDDNTCENSLAAFKAAAEMGVAIELDVRLTKDCRIVVFHDENLLRLTGADAKVCDFTYEQLGALTLCGGEKIPLLKDVLELVGGRVPILIELKGGSPIGVLEKRLRRLLRSYEGEYAVMSFDLRRVLWFRLFAPNITRGVLLSRFKEKPYGEYFLRLISANPKVWNIIASPDFIACDLRSVCMEDIIAAFNRDVSYISWTASGDELFYAAQKFSRSVIFERVTPEMLTEK